MVPLIMIPWLKNYCLMEKQGSAIAYENSIDGIHIDGIKANIELHQRILNDRNFIQGELIFIILKRCWKQ